MFMRGLLRFSFVILMFIWLISNLDQVLLAFLGHINFRLIKYLVYFSLVICSVFVTKALKIESLRLAIPIISISLLIGSSVLTSYDITITAIRFVLFSLFMIGLFIFVNTFTNEEIIGIIDKFYLISSSFIIVTSLYLLTHRELYIFAFYQGNFKGIFYNANFLGAFIGIFLLPYAFSRVICCKHRVVFDLLLAFFLLFILVETRSRAAMSSFLVGSCFGFYAFWKGFNGKLTKSKKIIFSIFLILIFSLSGIIFQLLYSKYNNASASLNTRTYIWIAHLEVFGERPLIGWGYGINPVAQDFSLKTKYEGLVNVRKGTTEKGNTYIALLEELGAIRGALIVLMLFILIFKILGRNSSISYFDIFSKINLLTSIIHVNFESWLFYPGNILTFLFWLILLLQMKNYNRGYNERNYYSDNCVRC